MQNQPQHPAVQPHFISGDLNPRPLLSPVEKKRIMSQIAMVDGVFLILDFHEASFRVVFYYENEKSLMQKIGLFKEISHLVDDSIPAYWKITAPPAGMKLVQIDWELLKFLRKNPRRSLNDRAEELGVSARTVQRRIKKMTSKRIAYLTPVRNTEKLAGLLCSLLVFCDESKKPSLVQRIMRLSSRIDFLQAGGKDILLSTIFTDNLLEQERISNEIRGMTGVHDIKVGIIRNFIPVDQWLDKQIDKSIARLFHNQPATERRSTCLEQ